MCSAWPLTAVVADNVCNVQVNKKKLRFVCAALFKKIDGCIINCKKHKMCFPRNISTCLGRHIFQVTQRS